MFFWDYGAVRGEPLRIEKKKFALVRGVQFNNSRMNTTVPENDVYVS